ncbi:hypothetical protein [Ensifer adhaerens]|uniref:hypothetical protein n=1 Tax=Ensifer adhaerens TaxID=106592 RepID=UPI001319CED9|nr:hypothetical protein [Ensifer adhaerens]
MKRIHLILGAMLLAPATASAQCVEVVRIGNNHGFYNGCNAPVMIGYTSDYLGKGTVGPLRSGSQEVTATPATYDISYRVCSYDDWKRNACSVQ